MTSRFLCMWKASHFLRLDSKLHFLLTDFSVIPARSYTPSNLASQIFSLTSVCILPQSRSCKCHPVSQTFVVLTKQLLPE